MILGDIKSIFQRVGLVSIDMVNKTSTPIDNTIISQLEGLAETDAGTEVSYTQIQSVAAETAEGTGGDGAGGQLNLKVTLPGSTSLITLISADGVTPEVGIHRNMDMKNGAELDMNAGEIRAIGGGTIGDLTAIPTVDLVNDFLLIRDDTDNILYKVAVGAVGSQTPWLQDIDADGFDLKDLSNLEFRDTSTGNPGPTINAIYVETVGMTLNVPTTNTFTFSINDVDRLIVGDLESEFQRVGLVSIDMANKTSTPIDNTIISQFEGLAETDTGTEVSYTQIQSIAAETANGTGGDGAGGQLNLRVTLPGSTNLITLISADGVTPEVGIHRNMDMKNGATLDMNSAKIIAIGGATIGDLTAIPTVDLVNDFLMIRDATDGILYKVAAGDVGGGSGGEDFTDRIRCVMEVPEGSVAYPDYQSLGTQGMHLSGMVMPDGASSSTINLKVEIPEDLASTPAPTLVIRMMSLGTGSTEDVRILVESLPIANGEDMDIAFTAETEATVAVPNLINSRFSYTQTLAPTITAGDSIFIQITRDPADVLDDYEDDIFIYDVFLQIDRTAT